MELRIFFMHSISYILVFAIIPLGKANYDATQVLKWKQMDLEYGEKLTTPTSGKDKLQQRFGSGEFLPINKKKFYPAFSPAFSPQHLAVSSVGPSRYNEKTSDKTSTEHFAVSSVGPSMYNEKTSTETSSEHIAVSSVNPSQYNENTTTKKPRSTRCTTGKPLPKLPADFIPSSDELSAGEHGKHSSTDDENNVNKPNKYLAPKPGGQPQHYIDDE